MKQLTIRITTIVALAATLTFAAAAPAAAGPCGNPGPGHSGYAAGHIVPGAQAGIIGQIHKPGTHQGYSTCL